MLKESLEQNRCLPSERESWTDSEGSFDRYVRENCCLHMFTILCSIRESKLSEDEKKFLFTEFDNQVIGFMESGKLDKAFYHDLEEYCDGVTEPTPPHLPPAWNVGLIFARHCGADKDAAYVAPTGLYFCKLLAITVELINTTGKSYQILEGWTRMMAGVGRSNLNGWHEMNHHSFFSVTRNLSRLAKITEAIDCAGYTKGTRDYEHNNR
jgi:hypothetical protein